MNAVSQATFDEGVAGPAETLYLGPGLGPISRARFRRLMIIYGVMLAGGLALWLLSPVPQLRVLGLGLWFPGAGFLADGWVGYIGAALSVGLFYLSLFLWYTTANAMGPAIVWLAAAGAAAGFAGTTPRPEAPIVAGVLLALYWARRYIVANKAVSARVAKGKERIAYIATALAEVAARAEPAPDPAHRELSRDDIAAMRYALDRGLQPVDRFDGFTMIEQFQMSSLRYQLNFLQWALALLQCHYTPNFHGYLSQAQRNLIAKFQDKRVWGYWIYEAIFGLGSLDFNPVARENIMLGGFMNLNVNLYMSNTGDTRYAKPGAFAFKLNSRKTYLHDAHTLNTQAVTNYMGSKVGLYGCEPHWSFPYCNLLALGGLPAHDRVFNEVTAPAVRERFRKKITEEFTHPDGTLSSGLNQILGLSVPSRGSYGVAAMAWLANPNFPDLARKFWAIVRTETVGFDEHGELTINKTGPFDSLDVGNYKKNETYLVSLLAIAAGEMGDYPVQEAAKRRLDRTCAPVEKDGYQSYDASGFANAHALIARLVRRDDWANMINHGPAQGAFTGPLLAEAAYPEVLVARAYSDGQDLSLTLYPGRESTVQTLGLERLTPNKAYKVTGAQETSIVADGAGAASLIARLDGRTEIHIAPAN